MVQPVSGQQVSEDTTTDVNIRGQVNLTLDDGEEVELFVSNQFSHYVSGELVATKVEVIFSSKVVRNEIDTYDITAKLLQRAVEVLNEQRTPDNKASDPQG